MAVSTDYSTPVMVNGFSCKNCTDVDYAKKHIDPAHPKAGPYGVDAASDPSLANKPSVTFDGALKGLNALTAQTDTPAKTGLGAQLDVSDKPTQKTRRTPNRQSSSAQIFSSVSKRTPFT